MCICASDWRGMTLKDESSVHCYLDLDGDMKLPELSTAQVRVSVCVCVCAWV